MVPALEDLDTGTFHKRELFYEQSGLVNPDGAQLNSCPVLN